MKILLVCTGNISRSPVAERLLAARLGPSVQAASAGTRAVVGHGIDERMLPYFSDVDTSGFVSRQLTAPIVRGSDLVLAMTDAHRSSALDLEPAAVRRTFTLTDFARWAAGAGLDGRSGGTPSERLAMIVSYVPELRARFPRGAGGGDVPDPYGHGEEVYARAASMIRASVDAIAQAACG